MCAVAYDEISGSGENLSSVSEKVLYGWKLLNQWSKASEQRKMDPKVRNWATVPPAAILPHILNTQQIHASVTVFTTNSLGAMSVGKPYNDVRKVCIPFGRWVAVPSALPPQAKVFARVQIGASTNEMACNGQF